MENTAEKSDLIQESESKRLLAVEPVENRLTSAQAKRLELYKELFQDYCAHGNIMRIAQEHGVSRGTVYNALRFFKETNLVSDVQISQNTALERIRGRIGELKAELVAEKGAGANQSKRFIAFLYSEIRKNEEDEHKILALIKKDGTKVSSNKIFILNNIRGTPEDGDRPITIQAVAESEEIPRQQG